MLKLRIAWGHITGRGLGVSQDLEKAAYWFEKSAEQGFPVPQGNLGNCYATGSGVTQDCEKAAFWYTKAAEQGDANAQFNLGQLYRDTDSDFFALDGSCHLQRQQGYRLPHNLAAVQARKAS